MNTFASHCTMVVHPSFGWNPVECVAQQGDMGELWKVEHQPGCTILDTFQGFDGTSGEPSQQRIAVIQMGHDDK